MLWTPRRLEGYHGVEIMYIWSINAVVIELWAAVAVKEVARTLCILSLSSVTYRLYIYMNSVGQTQVKHNRSKPKYKRRHPFVRPCHVVIPANLISLCWIMRHKRPDLKVHVIHNGVSCLSRGRDVSLYCPNMQLGQLLWDYLESHCATRRLEAVTDSVEESPAVCDGRVLAAVHMWEIEREAAYSCSPRAAVHSPAIG